jgi:hypothetical protein
MLDTGRSSYVWDNILFLEKCTANSTRSVGLGIDREGPCFHCLWSQTTSICILSLPPINSMTLGMSGNLLRPVPQLGEGYCVYWEG